MKLYNFEEWKNREKTKETLRDFGISEVSTEYTEMKEKCFWKTIYDAGEYYVTHYEVYYYNTHMIEDDFSIRRKDMYRPYIPEITYNSHYFMEDEKPCFEIQTYGHLFTSKEQVHGFTEKLNKAVELVEILEKMFSE